MIKILGYLKPKEWLMGLLSLGFVVMQVWLDLKLPEYMAEITTLVQTPGSAMGDIWRAGGMMLLCTLCSLGGAVIVGFFAAIIGARLSRRLRSLLFNRVDAFSMEEINRFSTDSLITRSTNDITQIQMIIAMGLQVMIRAPIMAIWAIIKISGKGYEWTLATGIAVLVLLVMSTLLMIFAMPKFKKMQSLIDNMNRVTRENLTGLRVVRAYNAEGYQEEKFEKANEELTATQLFTSRAMAIAMPVITMTISAMSLTIYWIGAYLIDAAPMVLNADGVPEKLAVFANMVVFMQYSVQIIFAFMMLVMIFIMLPRASVSAVRIKEVLDTKPSLLDGTRETGVSDAKGEVEFRNVSFKYPDAAEYVLEDVNFTAGRGESVAFIGSTGSGKSTLINLVPRFFDATEGEILINGVDIRDYTSEALLNKIGYVPQRAVIFKGTISSNIAFGDNGSGEAYSEEEVKKAAEIAQAAEFIEQIEDGYMSEIAQEGTNISGGQKQRIAIARAVCRNPEIYVFDDSFSALDYKTDKQLRNAIKKETKGVTSLIVAQRIATIMDADKIIVLDEGRVVGQGTHRELLRGCEVYRQIAESQLSEEELAS
ncbi:MAG: ABC transporter ATP-binding protein/permease [Oscillospiraceae bacterium]|nr:ABC transporter ATP-binding protein/permease [Oscillospiraceae bacterium]